MHNDAANSWTFVDSTSRSPHPSVWARNNSIMYLYKWVRYIQPDNPVQVAERLRKCNACHFNNSPRYHMYVSGQCPTDQFVIRQYKKRHEKKRLLQLYVSKSWLVWVRYRRKEWDENGMKVVPLHHSIWWMLPFSSGPRDARSFSGTDTGSCSGISSSAAPCSNAALCCSKCEPCFLLTLVSERKEKGWGIQHTQVRRWWWGRRTRRRHQWRCLAPRTGMSIGLGGFWITVCTLA